MAAFEERFKSAGIQRDVFDSETIQQLIADYANGLVSLEALTKAVQAGIDAVPDSGTTKPTVAKVVAIWEARQRKYAREFPARYADRVEQAAHDAQAEAAGQGLEDAAKADLIMAAVDAAVEASRAEALTYSDPAWGAGQQGYGDALGSADVDLDWVCDGDPCPICAPLPDGNPYTINALPMWPGDTHPNCRCYVTPDDASWQAIFGDAAA
jgi:hypothetical protein